MLTHRDEKKQLFQEKQTTSRIIKETQCNFPSLLLLHRNNTMTERSFCLFVTQKS